MARDTAFPNDHREVPTPVLIDVYDRAAQRLAQVLVGLTQEQLWARVRGPSRWSIGEIVCHLADSEAVASMRFRLIRSGSHGLLPTYDQDAWAGELQYGTHGERESEAALHAFGALRHHTSILMRSWDAGVWALSGDHPDWGPLTLRQLLELYADHGERHFDQILDSRSRLRRPVSLPSILSGRLNLTGEVQGAASGGVR